METPEGNVRRFTMEVQYNLIPFHTQVRPHFTNIKMKGANDNNIYFNSLNDRITKAQATYIQTEYNEIIKSRATAVINFWRGNVEDYFNRRAYGMFMSGGELFATSGERIDKSIYTKRVNKNGRYTLYKPTEGRSHTGQLKRALQIEEINYTGVTFYVQPCISKSEPPIDYVNILMMGAEAGGPPYHPKEDTRYHDGSGRVWGGISDNYWTVWQMEFLTFLNKKEQEMNSEILDMLQKFGIIGKDVTYNQYVKTEPQTTRVDKSGREIGWRGSTSLLGGTGGLSTYTPKGRRK